MSAAFSLSRTSAGTPWGAMMAHQRSSPDLA
ncbi:Uncharacterised protein [Bordetella pertussis]|nr:Uncharacterised protein [Bordetella pertussis]